MFDGRTVGVTAVKDPTSSPSIAAFVPSAVASFVIVVFLISTSIHCCIAQTISSTYKVVPRSCHFIVCSRLSVSRWTFQIFLLGLAADCPRRSSQQFTEFSIIISDERLIYISTSVCHSNVVALTDSLEMLLMKGVSSLLMS